MAIEIVELGEKDKKRRRDFLDVAREIYADDPAWVRPLDMDIEDRLDRKKNPFFDHGDAQAFVAYRDGRRVGRITAQIDHTHLERHKDAAGFFGFLDTLDDPEVARALLEKAADWNRARGMKLLRGPISLNINEELGCLVEGFDTPPMIMMPHHRPYQGGLIEQAGLAKLKDFYAWTYDVGSVPTRAQKAHDEVLGMPEVTVRHLDPAHFGEEVRVLMDIFNDAWSDNWGFVPLSERELAKMAADMKLILFPEITYLVSIDGEPAAVALALPNINEVIRDFDGKLFPFNVAKLLYRLRVKGPKSGRLIILGIKKKYRHVRKYAGLSAFLYVAMNRSAHLLGLERGELSWTLEDNAAINAGIRLMGGRIYKKYRVYQREL
ncbi:hypothetical protein [Polyangium sorediatum]|uniref:N-acetyltransferase domain-containing protein n=1 Tax=Polyangium sorediatum TaxID=889274 RepID=A0ABT6NYJ9_9BACT|nr:hypothetical protein [Polyangium sorediatum]MDI1433217.1 hypothetical protein [Polyangium sorediatum]